MTEPMLSARLFDRKCLWVAGIAIGILVMHFPDLLLTF